MAPLITLVPNSAVQFWDQVLDIERLPNRRRTFWEERLSDVPDATGHVPAQLRPLVEDETTRELIDPATGRAPPEEDTYAIGRGQALEVFLGKWVPLPFFLVRGRTLDGREDFAPGPTNWVRARLVALPEAEPGRTHHLTLAFDTALVAEESDYLAPTPANAERQDEFALAAAPAQSSLFLNEGWVGEWLGAMLRELQHAKRGGRPLTAEDTRRACEHLARYLVFLDILSEADILPRVRLLDTVSGKVGYDPVAVDLVLDIGNARTCGLLVEEHPGQGMNLTDSYPLALRDLGRPELTYARPFDSHVEFARASFGRDDISRKSGRPSAFAWSNPMRVGPEAVRLAAARLGNEGATGLSSPKRYLWDERLTTQGWRFNGRSLDGSTTEPPVSGPFMRYVGEDGTVLRGRGSGQPAVRARFSRSALFTFMLAEILLQVLCQINGPATRAARRDVDKPRRLRRVLLTLPPGMPVFEQQILRARAAAAVRLVWDMQRWTDMPAAPREPQVLAHVDEATATQIVWLHNEVAERFAGDAASLFALLGRERPQGGPGHSLRVASIDIGGGTTDLMVTTFTRPQGELIVPAQEFRESFKIAGDDVLHRVIVTVVVPAIERALEAAGASAARDLLTRALGQDLSGQSEQTRQARRVFVSHVLEPVGLAVLQAYERSEQRGTQEIFRATIGEVLATSAERGAVPTERLARHLEDAAREAGAIGFRVADIEVVADARRVDAAAAAVLGRVLADLCEVVWHYDCDVLLLSGRPSRMRAVLDIVLAKAPVPPHRIVGMHRYRVGERYPFRDAANRIDDPKTTAVVGAMLCVQAEGRLRNFMLRASQFTLRSTARIIGRMNNDGQIVDENVLLDDADLDAQVAPQAKAPATAAAAARDGFTVTFQSATLIGFRQLPVARWTATPLYMMEFANPDTVHRLMLPLRVTVRRREEDPESTRYEAAREHFMVEEIEDASGSRLSSRDVTLRLQTIDDQDGYWRDTGRLAMN
jgi:hypothetical protein